MGYDRLRVCASSNGSRDDVRVDANVFPTGVSLHTSSSVESVQHMDLEGRIHWHFVQHLIPHFVGYTSSTRLVVGPASDALGRQVTPKFEPADRFEMAVIGDERGGVL